MVDACMFYAPTYAASREEKNRFFESLQDALSSIPSGECFVMLGDFNAHVGSRCTQVMNGGMR